MIFMRLICNYALALAKIRNISRFTNFKHVKFLLRKC